MVMFVSLFFTFSAHADGPQNVPAGLDPAILSKMNATQQNAYITAFNEVAKERAGNFTPPAASAIKDVADKVTSIDTTDLVKKADNIADAIVAFCTKIGVAAADLIKSPMGSMIIIIGLLIYSLKVGIAGKIAFMLIGIPFRIVMTIIFIRMLYLFNTMKTLNIKKKVTSKGATYITDENGNPTVMIKPKEGEEETIIDLVYDKIVPRFSIFSDDDTSNGTYKVFANIVIVIIICFLIFSMF